MGFFSRKKKEDKPKETKVESPASLDASQGGKAELKVEKKTETKIAVKADKKDTTKAKKVGKKTDLSAEASAKAGAKKSEKKSTGKIKGANSAKAYEVLLKPLITEKASELGALNKYVFAINPRMNKIEVKKAIRTLYKVDPIGVNIINLSGRKVRYGRISGKTKSWKKAIVTLKDGDSIEVYEGV